MISGILHKLYDTIQQAVFPPKCLACETFYWIPERSRCWISGNPDPDAAVRPTSVRDQAEITLATCLCPDCLAGLNAVESPLCSCCGLPFSSRQDQDHYCGDCLESGQEFGIARAPLVYDSVITNVIHCFKIQRQNSIGPTAR